MFFSFKSDSSFCSVSLRLVTDFCHDRVPLTVDTRKVKAEQKQLVYKATRRALTA
jgi:hypothetical protein